MQLLKEELSNAESIVGEVEDPNSGKTEEEQKNRIRRISFYLRNGCRDTGVKAKVFGVKYRILELVIDKKQDQMIR